MTKENFIERLQCWIKQGLINMQGIQPVSGCGGCNFPIVLYTLSCMEWLGFLLRDCGASTTQLNKTTENLDGCLDFFEVKYHDIRIRNIIKLLFRHGLVHQFGPKFSGISRGYHFDPPIAFHGLIPVLDADQLANDFIKAVDKITEGIVKGEIDYNKINRKIEFIFKNDYKEFEKLIVTFSNKK